MLVNGPRFRNVNRHGRRPSIESCRWMLAIRFKLQIMSLSQLNSIRTGLMNPERIVIDQNICEFTPIILGQAPNVIVEANMSMRWNEGNWPRPRE